MRAKYESLPESTQLALLSAMKRTHPMMNQQEVINEVEQYFLEFKDDVGMLYGAWICKDGRKVGVLTTVSKGQHHQQHAELGTDRRVMFRMFDICSW